MNNIFDSHAHYDDKKFDKDRDQVISSLPEHGVRYVMNAACDLDSAKAGIRLAERYSFMYASVGVHPHEAKDAPSGFCGMLKPLLSHPKVKAVGEIGLDYHYDFSPRDIQLKVFEEQLKLALELDLPVIIHDREAHEDTMRMLRRYAPTGVVHCYSGSAEMARELLRLGFYIGFTGVVTFKNASKTLRAVSGTPLDRLLIETDCPYMAPEPYRGTRCDSLMLLKTAEAIANVKAVKTQDILDATMKNALELYRIPQ